MTDPQFLHLDGQGLLVWIGALCYVCYRGALVDDHATVLVPSVVFARYCRCSVDHMRASLSELVNTGVIEVEFIPPDAVDRRQQLQALIDDAREQVRSQVRDRRSRKRDGTITGGTPVDETSTQVRHDHPQTRDGVSNGTGRGERGGSPAVPDLLALWNENCGAMPQAHSMSEKRKRAWRSRWLEKPDSLYWAETIQRMSCSAFCRGERGDWKATIDFLLRPDTHVKVGEGAYDDNKSVLTPKNLNQDLWDAVQRGDV